MKNLKIWTWMGVAGLLFVSSCKTIAPLESELKQRLPKHYSVTGDSSNSSDVNWRTFFNDPYLAVLIDSALANNRELQIVTQEMAIARNEVKARKGEYLPFLGIQGGAGMDKVGRYTRNGALEATTDIEPGEEFPEPYSDYTFGAVATWEIDVWKKLRNAKKAAAFRYLSSVEGRNFMVTQLIAEIAEGYYELLALDNQLTIVKRNIEIQSNALEIVRLQKQATKVTELAVKKFEAEVFRTRSLQFEIQQRIIETENQLNFLLGRFPQPIDRKQDGFSDLPTDSVLAGLPAQLLDNRPDIRQMEMEVQASKLDVKVAKARFYPNIGLSAGFGYQAFNTSHLLLTPESMMYNLAGELMAPLINRNAIKAEYRSASARQIQTVYDYEQTLLKAYVEVQNQLAKMDNLSKSFELRRNQVNALTQSINISTGLFKSARADYMEVLMTQRDALEARFELIETKRDQLHARVNFYRVVGGGWK